VHKQQIFLPVVEEAEITLGVAPGPHDVLQSFLGAHGSNSTAGQLVVRAGAMRAPDRHLSEARTWQAVNGKSQPVSVSSA
jgi:hypothetical protein